MKTIQLTKGHSALVDDDDYERVSAFKWTAQETPHTTYGFRQSEGGKVYLHRFVLRLSPGGQEVDHINGNGLDNRRSNLRLASVFQNRWNNRVRNQRKAKTSKFKGVFWNTQRRVWQASICAYGKTTYLGQFSSEIDAAKAYDRAAQQAFGEFARTNIIW